VSGGPSAPLKRLAFRTFGALPEPVRRGVIRTIRPSWTAGAVAIIERDDGRWLFVKPIYRKGWTLPGGLIDNGEHPSVTIVREMGEEIGVSVTIVGEPWTILDPNFNRVEVVYRVVLDPAVDPDEIVVTTAELSDLGWYDPADPPPIEDETTDVLALAKVVAAGGSTVRIRGDVNSA
jgi:8-oxo-dGTP diphosphatase